MVNISKNRKDRPSNLKEEGGQIWWNNTKNAIQTTKPSKVSRHNPT